MKPDIIANLRFLRAEEGGRSALPPSSEFPCVFEVDGVNFDCRVLLGDETKASASGSIPTPIAFLSPENALPRVDEGTSFRLRDYRVIAEGVVAMVEPALTAALPLSVESRR